MQNKGRETGKEIKQTTQIEIGRDEKKQVDERKNQNVGKNKYIELSIKGGRNRYGRSKTQLNCMDRKIRDRKTWTTNEKKTRKLKEVTQTRGKENSTNENKLSAQNRCAK